MLMYVYIFTHTYMYSYIQIFYMYTILDNRFIHCSTIIPMEVTFSFLYITVHFLGKHFFRKQWCKYQK